MTKAHSFLISSNQTVQGQKNYSTPFTNYTPSQGKSLFCFFRHRFTVKVMALTTFKIIQMITKLQLIWITYVFQLIFPKQSKYIGRKRDLSTYSLPHDVSKPYFFLEPLKEKFWRTPCFFYHPITINGDSKEKRYWWFNNSVTVINSLLNRNVFSK